MGKIRSLAPMWTFTVCLMAMEMAAAAGGGAVEIDNFKFVPAELTVKVGTKATFTNHDDVAHSVVAVRSEFHSKPLEKGESFVIVLDRPAVIDYFCGMHGDMRGRITVVP